ncbi:MAG TPA: hypothetical protein VJ874_04680 [Candidatus Thermoplasmatota archaeon]|nr:hypothetical protein [Candidatus Thermoplasmatota archaeon]
MAVALLLTFDARQTIFGRLTAERPGLIIRAWDTAELRAASRNLIEMRGGKVDLATLLHRRIDVEVHTETETATTWSGWIEYKVPSQLDGIPIVRAIREVRGQAERIVVQFQGGAATMRLDLKERPKDAFDLLSRLRQHLRANGIVASLQIQEAEGSLEGWNPKQPILP